MGTQGKVPVLIELLFGEAAETATRLELDGAALTLAPTKLGSLQAVEGSAAEAAGMLGVHRTGSR